VFMGHAELQTVQRYIRLLPQRDEGNPVARLDRSLRVTLVWLLDVAVAATARLTLHRAGLDRLRRSSGRSGRGLGRHGSDSTPVPPRRPPKRRPRQPAR
jgi:hypothetical protein